MSFLSPPAFKPEQTGAEADARYRRLRWQVFLGAFIGYAGFYIVRKNFSMAIPMLEPLGFEKGELGVVLSMNAVAYGFSKFLMVLHCCVKKTYTIIHHAKFRIYVRYIFCC